MKGQLVDQERLNHNGWGQRALKGHHTQSNLAIVPTFNTFAKTCLDHSAIASNKNKKKIKKREKKKKKVKKDPNAC